MFMEIGILGSGRIGSILARHLAARARSFFKARESPPGLPDHALRTSIIQG